MATSGNDAISGTSGNDTIDGLEGDDSIQGWDGNDLLVGGAGNDLIEPGAGADSVDGGEGSDYISNNNDGSDDIIDGGAGDDVVQYAFFGSSSPITFVATGASGVQADGLGGTDTLLNIESEHVFGGNAGDQLSGDSMRTWLQGNGGDDTLSGGAGGNDTFAWDVTQPAGVDTVTDLEAGETLVFNIPGGTFALTAAVQSGDDPSGLAAGQVMVGTPSGGVTTVYVQSGQGAGLITMHLSGTVVASDFRVQNDGYGAWLHFEPGQNISGTGGNDNNLQGGASNDTIDGGAGDDFIHGGPGADSLVGGSGNDFFGDNADGASDTIDGGAGSDGVQYGFDGLGGPINFTATGAQGFQADGLGGTDTLISIENENISGSSGNDTITGDSLFNWMQGNGGDDSLTGGDGMDSFSWNVTQPSGIDTITDLQANEALNFSGPGINFNFTGPVQAGDDPSGLTAGQAMVGSTLDGITKVYVATGLGAGTITVQLQGSIQPADLVIQNDPYGARLTYQPPQNVTGTPNSDNLQGGAGNDTFYGVGGNDFINAGAGADEVHGGADNDYLANNADGANDTLDGGEGWDVAQYAFGGSPTGVNFTATGATGSQDDGYGGTDLLVGIESEHIFGSEGNDTITGDSLPNWIQGNGGDDSLAGGAGANDTFSWDVTQSAGTDTIADLAANETLNFSGPGVTFNFAGPVQSGDDPSGLTAGQVMVGSPQDGITKVYVATGLGAGTITVQLQGSIQPSDLVIQNDPYGARLTYQPPQNITGTPNNDNLQGGAGNDTISSAAGDDFINAGAGADDVQGGDGNDYLANNADGANDTLNGGAGWDVAQYSFGGSSAGINFTATGSTGSQADGYGGTDSLINIENEHVFGSSGNDTIAGDSLPNWFQGNGGDDSLTGGVGANDTFSWDVTSPAGMDTIGDLAPNENLNFSGPGLNFNFSGPVQAGDDPTGLKAGQVMVGTPQAGVTKVYVATGLGAGTITVQLVGSIAPTELVIHNEAYGARLNYQPPLVITGTPGTDYLVGGDSDDSIDGQAGNDGLTGGPGADTLTGGSGSDGFNYDISLPPAGADLITDLGVGDNLNFFGPNPFAITSIAGGSDPSGLGAGEVMISPVTEGVTTVYVGVDSTPGADLAIRLQGDYKVGDFYAQNLARNAVVQYAPGQSITGSAGNDNLQGGEGPDTIDGLAGNDVLSGNGGNDLVIGGAGNDNLSGWIGDDTLLGGTGQDFLGAGPGNDSLDGGAVTDRVNYSDLNQISYADAPSAVHIDLQAGTALDGWGNTDALANLNLVEGSNYNDMIFGSSAPNWFEQLRGGLGDDTLDGGAIDLNTLNNTNRVSYQTASGPVTVDLAAGTTSGAAGNDVLSNFNAIWGSNYADTLYGSGFASEEYQGGAGSDYINGRSGTDGVRYGSATTGVVVNLANGTASDGQGGSDTLVGIEIARGSNFNDTLIGGNPAADGFEAFYGDGGSDSIDGGSGFDRADYASSTGAVTATLGGASAGTANDGMGGIDTLLNIEGLRGSANNDTLTGSDANWLEAFEGRAGSDRIDGRGGEDRADFKYAPAAASVDLAAGSASDGWGGTDTLLNIEDVRGTAFADTVMGNGGNNVIEGWWGNDSLAGGGGNDVFVFDAADNGIDTIVDFDPGDRIFVRASLTNGVAPTGNGSELGLGQVQTEYVPPADGQPGVTFMRIGTDSNIGPDIVIRLHGEFPTGFLVTDNGNGTSTLSLPGIEVTGTDGSETLFGTGSSDTVSGLGGDDLLFGQGGDDSILAGAGNDYIANNNDGANDTIDGGVGNDVVSYHFGGSSSPLTFTATGASGTQADGAGGVDTLQNIEEVHVFGGSGNDSLTGDSMRNWLQGNGGDDTLTGGAGNNDTFAWDVTQAAGFDVITDFSPGEAFSFNIPGGSFQLTEVLPGWDVPAPGQVMVQRPQNGTTTISVGTGQPNGPVQFTVSGAIAPTDLAITNNDFGAWLQYSPQNTAPRFTPGDQPGYVTFGMAATSTVATGLILLDGGGSQVTANTSTFGQSVPLNVGDLVIYRLDAAGRASTGTGGSNFQLVSAGPSRDSSQAQALQPDGKLLIAGQYNSGTLNAGGGATNNNFEIVRLNADGTPDATFGSGGIVVTQLSTGNDGARAIALQGDGKILVAGSARMGANSNDFAIARYNANGTLDGTFGTAGVVTTNAGGSETVRAVQVTPEGQILAYGTSLSFTTAATSIFTARYNSDGSRDMSFGTSGFVVAAEAQFYALFGMTVLPDHSVLVAGTRALNADGSAQQHLVAKLTSGGSLDTNFGTGGYVSVDLSPISSGGWTAKVQPDGKIVVAGFNQDPNIHAIGVWDIALVRYNPDGTLDTNFGSGGKVVTDIGHDPINQVSDDAAYDLAIGSDGKITIVGQAFNGPAGVYEAVVVRYNADGSLDSGFGGPVPTSYQLGAPPVVLDARADVGDFQLDNMNGAAGNYGGTTVTVARAGGANADDVFSAKAGGTLGSLGEGADLILGGAVIGVVGHNSGGELVLQFQGTVTHAQVLGTFDQVAYCNSGASTGDIHMQWTFDDGNTGAQGAGGSLSASHVTTVSLLAAPVTATEGPDSLEGTAGNDSIAALGGNDNVQGRDGNDTIAGGGGDDFINAGGGADSVQGGAGNDYIANNNDGANDTLDGGADNDVVQYAFFGAQSPVTFAATGASGQQADGAGGTDRLLNIEEEHVFGGNAGDQLSGDSMRNWLQGNSGNDTLTGGAGGNDTFAWDVTQSGGVDSVTDLQSGENLVFNIPGSTYALSVLIRSGDDPSGLAAGEVMVGTASAGVTNIYVATGQAAGVITIHLAGNMTAADFYVDNNSFGAWLRYQPGAVFTGTAGPDNFQGGQGPDTIDGMAGNDTLSGNLGNDLVIGGSGNDTLYGSFGDDTLLGGSGSDFIGAGPGNDSLDGGEVLDRVNYVDLNQLNYGAAPAGIDLNLQAGTVQDGYGNTDTIANFNIVTGSSYDDVLSGSTTPNWFEYFLGGPGNDTIDGGAIDLNTLNNTNRVGYGGANGPVVVDLAAGTASGAAGNDILVNISAAWGTNYADSLYGSSFVSEEFQGAGGNDYIDGRGGTDGVRYSSATTGVVIDLAHGTASDGLGGSDTLVGIEIARGSSFNDTLLGGNPAADGFEALYGEGGSDSIDGGSGYDRADYASSTGEVTATLGGASPGTANDGMGGTDTLLNIEGLRGSANNDTLTGSDANWLETFEGRGGNDRIDGRGGEDRADFRFAPSGASVNLATGSASDGWGGTDTLRNIEDVRGTAFADTVMGTAGDNVIEGWWGDDSLSGGGGEDTFTYDASGNGLDLITDFNVGDRIVVRTSLVTGTSTAGDGKSLDAGYVQTQHVAGDGGAGFTDVMVGTDNAPGADIVIRLAGSIWGLQVADNGDGTATLTLLPPTPLIGSAGPDSISGGPENDVMKGRAGDDSLVGGTGNDTIYGTFGNDTMLGGDGNDQLGGILGIDDMRGGAGDDRYYVGSTLAKLLELENEGFDSVFSRADFTLPSGFETLKLMGNAVLGVGNPADNVLSGNAVGNGLQGLDGADTLDGYGGPDTLDGANGSDLLRGGSGADQLIGGAGDDRLRGGADSDIFIFSNGGGNDRLLDFNAAEGDRIGLPAAINDSGILDGATALAAATQVGHDTVLDLGGGNSVTLAGVDLATLTAACFLFS